MVYYVNILPYISAQRFCCLMYSVHLSTTVHSSALFQYSLNKLPIVYNNVFTFI